MSDLHFGAEKDSDPGADAEKWYGPLAADLCNELGLEKLDAAIISGDIGSFSEPTEYKAAKLFLYKLCKKFSLDKSRIIIVPGNHDLNWNLSQKAYSLLYEANHKGHLKDGHFHRISKDVIDLRNDKTYPKRFQNFRKFYKGVTGTLYPLDPKKQATLHHIPNLNLLIAGFNSAWEADHHFENRISINPNALEFALDQIRERPDFMKCLKFAVWHHPLESEEDGRIKSRGFMQLLAQADFRICFHGHIHKSEAGLFRYDMSPGGRQIHVVGAGTFGAPAKEWTDGYPLQYNLLRLSKNTLRVYSRRRIKIDGTWESDHLWRQGRGKDNLAYYDISLSESSPKKSGKKTRVKKTSIKKTDSKLETEIKAYCEKDRSLHEELPLFGFKTILRVPILIEDIYIPLRAMVDRRVTGDACYVDADDAEKCLRGQNCEEISVPEAFRIAKELKKRGIVILGDPGSGGMAF